MLKKLILIAAIVYTMVLTFLCLIKSENIPDLGVSFADKIYHFLAYSMLTFLWFLVFFFNFNFKINKAIICSVVTSILYGIIIEVLQETITDSRILDINDIFANTCGVIATALVIRVKKNIGVKKI